MASTPQHEPTMEEILASIRKIISEDSTEAQPQPQPFEQRAPAPVHEADADVLELTQEVVEEHAPPPPPEPEPVQMAPVALAPAPAQQMAAPPPPAAAEPEQDVVFQHIEEPKPIAPAPAPEAPPAPAPAPQSVRPSDSIFSESAREAVQKAFARGPEPEESFDSRDDVHELPAIDGKTVEALFMRAIKESFGPVASDYLRDHSDDIFAKMAPLLRDWMDSHFPPLLERAVRAEVARVVDDHFPSLVRSEVERALKSRR